MEKAMEKMNLVQKFTPEDPAEPSARSSKKSNSKTLPPKDEMILRVRQSRRAVNKIDNMLGTAVTRLEAIKAELLRGAMDGGELDARALNEVARLIHHI